jgi:uncharacterized membrane protein
MRRGVDDCDTGLTVVSAIDRFSSRGKRRSEMPRSRLYLLALSLVLGVSARALAQDPTFTRIEPPDGNGTITFLFDVNDRGDMVGAYNAAPDGHRYGFQRSRGGQFARIDFPGSVRTHADGINRRGDIVGWYARVVGEFHGFLLRRGEFTRIDVPGAMGTKAIGINGRGEIVGFYCLVTPPACGKDQKNARGFLFSEGQLTTIDVPGALATEAYKINARGQILGSYVGSEGRSHLFLLSEGEFTTIDVPGAFETGVDGTNAGLNSRGDIVGDYCDAEPCGNLSRGTVHGFLLKDELTNIDAPGAVATSAYGINARGDIVGVAQIDAVHIVGFLWSMREPDQDEENEDDAGPRLEN